GLGLPGGRSYTEDQIKGMYGHSEIDLRFHTPIPVHITYQTAFVDEKATLQIREDIYGRDAQTLAALKSGNRRELEIPVARAGSRQGRPPVKLPSGVAGAYNGGGWGWGSGGSSSGSSGQSFFDQLFGNPIRQ